MTDRQAPRQAAGSSFRRHAILLTGAALVATLAPGVALAQAPGVAPAPAFPPLYSPDSDPFFAQPYIDVDEMRDAPVRHRYVHGGFKGTETRFSFYFPPKEQYRGRFFHYITPFPLSENTTQAMAPGGDNPIAFAIASGAYFVETNTGGRMDLGKAAATRVDP